MHNTPLQDDRSPSAPGATDAWEGLLYDGVATSYGSVPPACLRATPEKLRLYGDGRDFRLPRAMIWKIDRSDFHPWRCRAVQIHHHVAEYPNELQFKPAHTSPGAILDRLKNLGYPAS